MLYTTPKWEIDACVEADLGTERPIRFARKVADYVAVLRSGAWRGQLASWPVVLTVAPSA